MVVGEALSGNDGACRSIILPCDKDRRKRFGRGGGQMEFINRIQIEYLIEKISIIILRFSGAKF